MIPVLVLLYVFAVFAATGMVLSLFIGTARKLLARGPPIQWNRAIVYELIKWASLIIAIAFVFIGVANLLVTLA